MNNENDFQTPVTHVPFNPVHIPFSLMTDGNFADFESTVNLWPSYPAYQGRRGVTWACNWEAVSNLPRVEISLAAFGAVPSMGMCYHTEQERGIANMKSVDQELILRMFRDHANLTGS